MKNYGKVEIASMIIVSTAHITEKDAGILETKIKKEAYAEDPDHWVNDIEILGSDYAYMISMSSLSLYDKEKLPKWLRNAYEMCDQLGALWIMFDKDGLEVDGLESYDW